MERMTNIYRIFLLTIVFVAISIACIAVAFSSGPNNVSTGSLYVALCACYLFTLSILIDLWKMIIKNKYKNSVRIPKADKK